MSARLVRALRAGKVTVQNRTNGEVTIRYVDYNQQKAHRQIPHHGELELCPKLCPADYVKFSNVKDLIARRVVRIKKL